MRLIIEVSQEFRQAEKVWICKCQQLKIKCMARTKRECLVLLAKRLVRITNEEINEVL